MRIEASADQDNLRPDALGELFKTAPKRRVILGAARSKGQGNVRHVAETRTGAGLVARASPRIKRIAMDGEKPDAGRGVEDFLSSVAVVDVEINHEQPAQLEVGQRFRRAEGDIAVNAEAHSGRG